MLLAVERMAEEEKTQGYFDAFKWLVAYPQLIRDQNRVVLSRVSKYNTYSLYARFVFMATDVIGETSFGESFRMLETGKVR